MQEFWYFLELVACLNNCIPANHSPQTQVLHTLLFGGGLLTPPDMPTFATISQGDIS